jgi:hypothetical protein
MLGLAEMAWELAWGRVYDMPPALWTVLVGRENAFSGSTPAVAEYYRIIDELTRHIGTAQRLWSFSPWVTRYKP